MSRNVKGLSNGAIKKPGRAKHDLRSCQYKPLEDFEHGYSEFTLSIVVFDSAEKKFKDFRIYRDPGQLFRITWDADDKGESMTTAEFYHMIDEGLKNLWQRRSGSDRSPHESVIICEQETPKEKEAV